MGKMYTLANCAATFQAEKALRESIISIKNVQGIPWGSNYSKDHDAVGGGVEQDDGCRD